MGWANCGTDSKGRPIGYAHAATCDHPGCEAQIDRGLSYACGGMHGERATVADDADVCEGYFCPEHLDVLEIPDGDDGSRWVQACSTCVERAPKCSSCGMPSWALSEGLCEDCQ